MARSPALIAQVVRRAPFSVTGTYIRSRSFRRYVIVWCSLRIVVMFSSSPSATIEAICCTGTMTTSSRWRTGIRSRNGGRAADS